MSFERNHPNREVERNLARARDLRSSYLVAALATVGARIAQAWRDRRDGSATLLRTATRPISKGMQRAAAMAGLALLLPAGAAATQEIMRVRGTIERVESGAYLIKALDGSTLRLTLAPSAGVAASVKAALSDIKPGAFIGVAALPQADGTLRALEAHIFHESMRGTGEGHRPWDLLPKSTMTNATVHDVVHAVDGNTVTLKYKDGEQKIVIPAGTVVVTYLPGSVAELKAGATIFVPAANRQADGTLLAQRIMVGRDIAPPQTLACCSWRRWGLPSILSLCACLAPVRTAA